MRIGLFLVILCALTGGVIFLQSPTVNQGGLRADPARPGCVDKVFPVAKRYGESSSEGNEVSPWSTEIQYNSDRKEIKVWWAPQNQPTIEFTADLNCVLQWVARIEDNKLVDHRRSGHPQFGEYQKEFERIIQGAQSNPQRYTWY